MTDPLLNIALAGTARAGDSGPPAQTGTPLDELLAELPATSSERRLLLAAGALALYRQAGREPVHGATAPEPAPAEDMPACPRGAAQLIGEMLAGQQSEVLPEALDLVAQAGQRLPAELLPAALDLGARSIGQQVRSELLPAALGIGAESAGQRLLPVLGERGRWLSRFNPAWRWVDQASGRSGDPEELWAEGTPDERILALRRMRAQDPERARALLAATWKRDAAVFRGAALRTLSIGLTLGDEAFLEAALDDRAEPVRSTASWLLARLPGSGLATRMRERADALLDYEPPRDGGLSRLRRAVVGAPRGKLVITPPEAIDQSWQRDGVAEQPRYGMGQRVWWLMRTLALVAPEHWEERFELAPSELIAAVPEEWSVPIIEGWSQATIEAKSAAWARPLCEWLCGTGSSLAQELLTGLLDCLALEDAEPIIERVIADWSKTEGFALTAVLERIPRPWSVSFGEHYLRLLSERVNERTPRQRDAFVQTLPLAALALPPASWPAALRVAAPETPEWAVSEWRRALDRFGETIQTRRRLWLSMEESAQ